jgi:hypothetical protein
LHQLGIGVRLSNIADLSSNRCTIAAGNAFNCWALLPVLIVAIACGNFTEESIDGDPVSDDGDDDCFSGDEWVLDA